MRLRFLNRAEILGKFGSALAETIQAIVSGANGWAAAQHQGDGSHSDVTATALAVSGATALGKLRLRSVDFTDPVAAGGVVHNLATAGLTSVSCLRITPLGALQITGIDSTGRQRGDLLVVLNCDDTLAAADISLAMENTGSVAANRFAETTASPTSVGGNVVIQGGRAVWLIYDYQTRGTGSSPVGPRWRVLDPSV